MSGDLVLSLIGLAVLLVLTNMSLYVFTWLQNRVIKQLAKRIESLERQYR